MQDKGPPLSPGGTREFPSPTPACRAQRVPFYALLSIVILAKGRTSSWLGVDGLVVGYLQRRHKRRLPATPATGDRPGRGLRLGSVTTRWARSVVAEPARRRNAIGSGKRDR